MLQGLINSKEICDIISTFWVLSLRVVFFGVFWDFLFVAAMETDRKIIIAVDDSETSAYAFTWALHNLFKKSDKVIVLTAAPFVTLDFPSTDIASGTYTYIHTYMCLSFCTLLISNDLFCSCSILLLGIDLYIVLLMSSSFSFLFVCLGVWRRGFFLFFSPLCVLSLLLVVPFQNAALLETAALVPKTM